MTISDAPSLPPFSSPNEDERNNALSPVPPAPASGSSGRVMEQDETMVTSSVTTASARRQSSSSAAASGHGLRQKAVLSKKEMVKSKNFLTVPKQ